MAVWALGRLATAEDVKGLRLRFASEESDATVIEEWKIALADPAER
jgi:hypothetical protein